MKQREIKFKIWVYEKNLYWYDAQSYNKWAIWNINNISKEINYLNHCGCKHRILQYTNFKDCDGNEIYEGDLVLRLGGIQDDTGNYYTNPVRFHPYLPGWSAVDHIFNEVDPLDCDTYKTKSKVIGNVFEDFDLLKFPDTEGGQKYAEYIKNWFEIV